MKGVDLMKNKSAYLFWYKSSETARTEYIYIVAWTVKQARFYFFDRGFNKYYDYASWPVDEIPQSEWEIDHKPGTVLGDNAII